MCTCEDDNDDNDDGGDDDDDDDEGSFTYATIWRSQSAHPAFASSASSAVNTTVRIANSLIKENITLFSIGNFFLYTRV